MDSTAGNVKALIPAAGRGTRLAGLSGGGSKELIRLGPRTMIEHCLSMVLDSGVSEVAVVISHGKEAVRRAVEGLWAARGPASGRLEFLYQHRPLGVAEAMRLGVRFGGDDPLAVVMPDNLLLGGPPALGRMIAVYRLVRSEVIGVIELDAAAARLFGNVGLIELEPHAPVVPLRVLSLSPKGAGRLRPRGNGLFYKGFIGVIYLPGWPERIDGLVPNFQGELDDTDLVQALIRESRLWAAPLEGRGFDVGNPDGLEAARAALNGAITGEA
ncbi:MAG: NTP transferase domain-containing protein [Proteobacteria bacterium]|nr:NTP transferase domain-containing protein [Pseudomonadota bacterium]